MSLIRWLPALAAALLLAPAALAQEKKDPPKPDDTKPGAPTETPAARGTLPQNWKALGLTDEQKKKVYAIQSSYRTKLDDLERQVRELRAQERAELEKLLTDAQKARLKEIIAGKVPGGGDPTPPAGAKPPEGGTKPPDGPKPPR